MTPNLNHAPDELLALAKISKSFSGVRVLNEVSLNVCAGKTVGIVGENGAGKSTLMNIIGGNLHPEAGAMRFNGANYTPASAQAAARHGIAFIHQELNLFPNLTLAENLFLTSFPHWRRTPFIDRDEIRRGAARLLGEVGLDAAPHQLVETLSAGERQLVEIAKALSIDARLIIFDEPTTSLSFREIEKLFELMGRLRARGIAMIYISHALADVFRLCDEIVVLRDGEVVGSGATGAFTVEQLVSLMVGRTMSQVFPVRQKKPADEALLEVRAVSQPGVIENISFTLRRGEILGLSGLMGAGRSELVRILFGLEPHSAGSIKINGQARARSAPRGLIRDGVAFLTENRRTEGLCLSGAVSENLTLPSLPIHRRSPLGLLSRDSLRAAVARIRSVVQLDQKASDAQPAGTLSGGNQQKVVLGKWLLCNPRVLFLDEPTRGIDVGAKFQIYRLICELADQGVGILVISSEMEELMGLCDRILVMRNGQISDEMPREQFDRERILRAALGSATQTREQA